MTDLLSDADLQRREKRRGALDRRSLNVLTDADFDAARMARPTPLKKQQDDDFLSLLSWGLFESQKPTPAYAVPLRGRSGHRVRLRLTDDPPKSSNEPPKPLVKVRSLPKARKLPANVFQYLELAPKGEGASRFRPVF